MGSEDLDQLADMVVEKMAERGHVCLFTTEERSDIHEYSRAKREAKAGHGDIVNALLIGKSLNGWHVKSLNFGGLLLMLLIIWLTVKSTGLLSIIMKAMTVK